MQHPLTPDPPDLPPHSQVVREEAEGGEQVREAAGDGRESGKQTGPADRSGGSVEGGMRGESRGEGAESGSGDGEDEEEQEEEDKLTQVEELRCDQLESDSSFQRADGKDEMFWFITQMSHESAATEGAKSIPFAQTEAWRTM